MKRFLVVCLVFVSLFSASSLVYATTCPTCPAGPQGPQGPQGAQGPKGSNGTNCKNKTPEGVGIDVVLWENAKKNIALESQYKYDINNEGHSIFLVVKTNLFEIMKKK